MDIIINTISILLISFNIVIAYKNGKKLFKFIREKYQEKQELKTKINDQDKILNKSLKNLNIFKLQRPIQAKFTKEDLETFNDVIEKMKNENEDIYIFIQTLLKVMPKENLKNFISRIGDLSIEYHSYKDMPSENGYFISGTYNSTQNAINIYFDKNKSVLAHELLHAASTDSEYNRVGFSIIFEKVGMVGKGLNEGYTELLNQRLFNHQCNSYLCNSYLYLTLLAEQLEDFYENKEDMMTDYFNANIFNLIGELLKSMTLEEAIDIIVDMDVFLEYNLNTKYYLKLKQKIHKLLQKSPVNQEKEQNIPLKEKCLSMTYTIKNKNLTKLDK